MAMITKIKVKLYTLDYRGAGSDSLVYLGIGGREFRIESKGVDEYERATIRTYVLRTPAERDWVPDNEGLELGERPVRYPTHNDPSKDYPLNSDLLDLYPVYLRYQPRIVGGIEDIDTWILGESEIQILAEGDQIVRTYKGLPERNGLWLGLKYGLYYYYASPKPGIK